MLMHLLFAFSLGDPTLINIYFLIVLVESVDARCAIVLAILVDSV